MRAIRWLCDEWAAYITFQAFCASRRRFVDQRLQDVDQVFGGKPGFQLADQLIDGGTVVLVERAAQGDNAKQ